MTGKTYLIYFLLAVFAFAQDIHFKHLTIEDGLSQSTVNCIFQDSHGFLWIGTENGLNRYDGYEFTVFKHQPADSASLSHSWIWDIFEDSRNFLWVATWEGLNKYDPAQDKFIRYLPDDNDPYAISGGRPTALFEDEEGLLWIATWGGGINIYDHDTDQFKSLMHDAQDNNSLAGNQIRNIYYAADKTIWAATWNGLSHIKKIGADTFQINSYFHDPLNPASLSSDKVSSIAQDQGGRLWIGTFDNGLDYFDPQSGIFKHYRYNKNNKRSLSSNDIIALFVDKKNQLWVGTVNEGLNTYDAESNSFRRFKHNPKDNNSLNGDNVFSIFEDNSGLLWVGTNGLNVYNPHKKRFKHYFSNSRDKQSINHNRVTSFFEGRDGIVWVGTEGGGLNSYNPQSGHFKHFTRQQAVPGSLSNNNISSIVADKNGDLWIGTRGGGLNRFNPQSSKFMHYQEIKSNPATEGIYFINDLDYDREGKLWIATYDKGLIQYDIQRDKFLQFRGNPTSDTQLSSDYLLTLLVDNEDNIWVGTWGSGLNRYNKKTQRFERFLHNENDRGSISGNIINSIYESNGMLWVGTNIGLSYMNLKDSGPAKFRHILEEDGLPSNVICGILEDDSANLWISTNDGLSKFNPLQNTFKNYDANDGLQSNEFIAGSYLRLKNGTFLFGGINGFNAFFPDSITHSFFKPHVVFTTFKVFDKTISFNQSLNTLETIELQYWQNFFSFEFAALDYALPAKNRYAYMLQGFDDDWIYSGSRRYASYTNLDAGDYKLKIKGTNSDGVWNESASSIKITIIPPFWKTWWAYASYVILIIAGILGVIKMRSRKLEREKHQLEKIVNERTNEIQVKNIKLAEQAEKLKEVDHIKSRFFTNISHEFRTPLTLIKGPAEEMLHKKDGPDTRKAFNLILNNANRLLRLINQLLDLSKLESGAMELKAALQPLSPFVEVMVNLYSSLAESRHIHLEYIKPAQEMDIYFDHDKLEQVLNNLLSNAFKFTPENGFITVSLNFIAPKLESYPQGAAEISVHDSGSGIPDNEIDTIFERFSQGQNSKLNLYAGTGIGLALCKELVELHRGEIKVSSTANEGTEFDVILPVGKDHLQEHEIIAKSEVEPLHSTQKDVQQSDIALGPQQQVEQEANGATEKNLVLIVEDHPEVRDYIREHLQNEYQVIEAADGSSGLDLAREQLPDLIISDVMMPEMDGYQLTNSLKKDSLTSHIPIILLTAKAADEDKIAGLELGADAYMAKPFNARELEVRVKKLVETRAGLREKFRKEFLLEPADIKTVSPDDAFIHKVHDTIEENMADPDFNVESLLKVFALGQRQFTRKVLALTGQTPVQFIRLMRLKRARQLIEQQAGTVSQIAFDTGFNNLSYFSKTFRQHFGKLPSEI